MPERAENGLFVHCDEITADEQSDEIMITKSVSDLRRNSVMLACFYVPDLQVASVFIAVARRRMPHENTSLSPSEVPNHITIQQYLFILIF